MFRPLECFIGLRYLGSGRRGFVSFVSAASLFGIALGVAALLVILSVMNGLEAEFRDRLLSLSEHIRISPTQPEPGLSPLEDQLSGYAEIQSIAPFTEIEAMLSHGASLQPARVRGILPEREDASVSDVVGADALSFLAPDSGHVLLGRFLARNLGVVPGDRISVNVAELDGVRPRLKRTAFIVADVFDAGVEDHDAGLALVHLSDAGRITGAGPAPQSLGLRLHDPMEAPGFQARLAATLPPGYRFLNWADANSSLFRAMAIEKAMMTIILLFIVGVAAFNIVASLMMVVSEKRRDIAVLRTYGLAAHRVVRIFFFQGAMIGIAGTVIGTLLGLVLAANVETIVPWLEATFNFKIMPGDVFYVTEVPSEIHLNDVLLIPALALILSCVVTILPSRRAALVDPAQALRYE